MSRFWSTRPLSLHCTLTLPAATSSRSAWKSSRTRLGTPLSTSSKAPADADGAAPRTSLAVDPAFMADGSMACGGVDGTSFVSMIPNASCNVCGARFALSFRTTGDDSTVGTTGDAGSGAEATAAVAPVDSLRGSVDGALLVVADCPGMGCDVGAVRVASDGVTTGSSSAATWTAEGTSNGTGANTARWAFRSNS